MVLPIFLGALNKTTYIQIHTSYLKQWLKWSAARDNDMVYATSKGPRSNCLLADRKQIDQTTKVIRYLAPLDDFFFFFFFWSGFYGPFKNISLIASRSFIKSERKPEFIKSERKPENPGKKSTWPSVSRTWVSHMSPERGSNHNGERHNGLRVNSPINCATGARLR